MEIPQKFKERYVPLVDNPEAFLSSLLTRAPKSFRANTLKSSASDVRKRFESYGFRLRQMEWYPDAFVSDNPSVGTTLEHFLGHIYMQELTSMLPPLVLRAELEHGLKSAVMERRCQETPSSRTSPSNGNGIIMLDACAAPGSKTTQLAALMHNRGCIVANDLDYERIKALKFNMEKTGTLNVVITNQDLCSFPMKQRFDAILLDAPCSSEGTIRKKPEVLFHWSEKDIRSKSGLQKKLILKAFELLVPGGTLVYSTCTFAPEENEEVVDFLLSQTSAKIQKVDIPGLKTSPGIPEWNGKAFRPEVKKSVRIWSHQNDTDGFFLAKMVKP
jgi:NOL1/NOP2/sun family putative RNA methylase